VSLPGAAELFRVTGAESPGDASAEDVQQSRQSAHAAVETEPQLGVSPTRRGPTTDDEERTEPAVEHRPVRTRVRSAERRPTGRERHEEKITVYCSAEELIDLEHARLTLRGDFGLAVDRGRIVREAVAVVIADLEAKGANSILVRRLRGRS
jgi:hypothetical protein